jgi:hypothetical protein
MCIDRGVMGDHKKLLVCRTTEASFTEEQASPAAEVPVAKTVLRFLILDVFWKVFRNQEVYEKINPKNTVFDQCFLNHIQIGG